LRKERKRRGKVGEKGALNLKKKGGPLRKGRRGELALRGERVGEVGLSLRWGKKKREKGEGTVVENQGGKKKEKYRSEQREKKRLHMPFSIGKKRGDEAVSNENRGRTETSILPFHGKEMMRFVMLIEKEEGA